MSICDDCIHDNVCGLEDNHEESIVSCADRIPKDALDKIRAEIEKIELLANYTRGDIKRMALDVIDKYKAESDEEVCEWFKYDYRTVAPRNHDINNPYWRIPENRMEALKYCPYCGKRIEIEE